MVYVCDPLYVTGDMYISSHNFKSSNEKSDMLTTTEQKLVANGSKISVCVPIHI